MTGRKGETHRPFHRTKDKNKPAKPKSKLALKEQTPQPGDEKRTYSAEKLYAMDDKFVTRMRAAPEWKARVVKGYQETPIKRQTYDAA